MGKKNKEALIDVLKEKYQYENERKRYFDNVITLPVSLLAFIVTGIYFVVNENNNNAIFIEIRSLATYPLILITLICMVCLFIVFFGLKRRYCSFPDTETVLKDYDSIEKYYAANPSKNIQQSIDDDFSEFIITWYKDINSNNTKVNDLRAKFFHISKFLIIILYIICILVFGSYCYSKLKSISMAKPASAPTIVVPQPKPSPSPVRQEKGGQIVPPKK